MIIFVLSILQTNKQVSWCSQTGSLHFILQSPGCEEHYSCWMIDADWNATQCLACSISYCGVGCIHALISFLPHVTLYVWSLVICQPTVVLDTHLTSGVCGNIYVCIRYCVCSRVEVQGQSRNMIPFVMFNYQLTPHLSPSSTLYCYTI